MKKSIILFQFLLFCYLTHAQENGINPEWQNNGDLVFAAYVGLTTNSISSSEFGADDISSGNSFLLGLQTDYFFNDKWSLKGKFNYENRDFGSGADKYLNLTIAPVWHFGKNRRWHLHLGGSYSAFLDNSLADGSLESALGIGVIIPIKSQRFFIELDGVTNSNAFEVNFTDTNGNIIDTKNISTNRTSLNFGFLF